MQYYFSNDGANQQGPLDRDQLKAAGVTSRSMVWREGMAAWTPAGEVPELADLFANEPPPIQLPPHGLIEPNYATPPHVQETNGAAVVSLILAIIGLTGICCCRLQILASIAAIIFGHSARGQIKRGKGTGDGFALAGLILGYAGIILTLLGISLSGYLRSHGMYYHMQTGHRILDI